MSKWICWLFGHDWYCLPDERCICIRCNLDRLTNTYFPDYPISPEVKIAILEDIREEYLNGQGKDTKK